jgi:hypothetical protein
MGWHTDSYSTETAPRMPTTGAIITVVFETQVQTHIEPKPNQSETAKQQDMHERNH